MAGEGLVGSALKKAEENLASLWYYGPLIVIMTFFSGSSFTSFGLLNPLQFTRC